MSKSIESRLHKFIILTVFTVFVGALGVNYFVTRQYIVSSSQALASIDVKEIRNDLDRLVSGVEKTAQFVLESVSNGQYSDKEVTLIVKTALGANQSLYRIRWVKPTADEYDFYQGQAEPVLLKSNPAALNLLGSLSNVSHQWLALERVLGDKSTVSFVIYDPLTESAFVFDVALKTLDKLVQNQLAIDGANSFLLNGDGVFLSHPNKAQRLAQLNHKTLKEWEPEQWRVIVSALKNQDSDVFEVACENVKSRCTLVILGIENGWHVAIMYPNSAILAALESYSVRFISFFVLALGGLFFGVRRVIRSFAEPIVNLSNVMRKIGQGDFKAELPKYNHADEIAVLLSGVSNMQQALEDYIQKHNVEVAENAKLEAQIDTAFDIQQQMLPDHGSSRVFTADYDVWAELIPARGVAGDLYFIQRADNLVQFAVGDVSDKGVSAAIFMAKATTLIKQLSVQRMTLDARMVKLNTLLTEGNDACMFVTLLWGELNIDTGDVVFVSAGHALPFCISDNQITELGDDDRSGPALGLIEDGCYQMNTVNLTFEQSLVLYTDGVDEAKNSRQQTFGLEKTKQTLLSYADEGVVAMGEALLSELDDFCSGQQQFDDITLLALQRRPYAQWLLPVPDAARISQFAVASTPKMVSHFFEQLEEWLSAERVSPVIKYNIRLIGEELFANQLSYQSEMSAQHFWQVAVLGSDVFLQFSLCGSAFNPLQAPTPELGLDSEHVEIGGLGLFMIKEVTESATYARNSHYNQLCLKVKE